MARPYEKAFQRAEELFNIILTQEGLNEEEKFVLVMGIAKMCLESIFSSAAYSSCTNPNEGSNFEMMKKDVMSWIEDAIEEGNERYEEELN